MLQSLWSERQRERTWEARQVRPTSIATDVKTRIFKHEDLESIFELERLCFSDPYALSILSELAERNPDTFIVSIVNEVIVGYVVTDNWRDHDHLVSIAVHPDHRLGGIGTLLLEELESRLEKGRILRLEVRRSNMQAMNFYVKHGFKKRHINERYYADGEDAVVMEKRLRR